MTYDHTIRPATINILGNSPRTATPSHFPNTRDEPAQKQSLWGRVKSIVKKVFDYIKPVVTYIKDEIVPIVTAVVGFVNAWNNYRRCTEKARDSVCYA